MRELQYRAFGFGVFGVVLALFGAPAVYVLAFVCVVAWFNMERIEAWLDNSFGPWVERYYMRKEARKWEVECRRREAENRQSRPLPE